MLKQGYFYPKTPADTAAVRARFPGICGAGDMHCSGQIVHNGGWYNQLGEEIGWGDFSIRSMDKLAKLLSGDDIVVVVGEAARCGFEHPDRANWGPNNRPTKYDWSYLLEYVRWVLKDGTIYQVRGDFSDLASGSFDGIPVAQLPTAMVADLIK